MTESKNNTQLELTERLQVLKEEFKATIVVPKHRGDLPQGTLAAIIERSKLDENLFKP